MTSCIAIVKGKAYVGVAGRQGYTQHKQEGDGCTPVGSFALRQLFYRADRFTSAEWQTAFPSVILQPHHAWCDDVCVPEYNTQVVLPFIASHECLWREDHRYDVIMVLGYNDAPVVPGLGSAIFLHVMSEAAEPTAGCIAFSRSDLLAMLRDIDTQTQVQITADGQAIFY